MKKRTAILLTIFMLTVFAAMFIMSQDIISQTRETTALKERLHNLEVIFSYEFSESLKKTAG